MTRITAAQLVFGALLALILHAASAQALEQHTWVSGTGLFNNPCTRALPCREIGTALYRTVEGGQISVLDSGEFKPFEIDKSISIVAEGVEAKITVPPAIDPPIGPPPPGLKGLGIDIQNYADPDMIVSLHGLTLLGNGGDYGIFFASGGGQLHIRNCVIRGFKRVGVVVFEANHPTRLFISNTTIANNRTGIEVMAPFSSPAIAFLDNVIVERNSAGIGVSGLAVVQLNDTTVTANGTGLSTYNGGQFESFGNNALIGNSSNGVVPTLVPLQ